MPPLKFHLDSFVNAERQDSDTLKALLNALCEEPTHFIHKRSGTKLNALQFLYLRYRGRPGARQLQRVVPDDVVHWLVGAEFMTEDGIRCSVTHLRQRFFAPLKECC